MGKEDIKREREVLQSLESLISKGMNEEALKQTEENTKIFPDSFQLKFLRLKALILLSKNIAAQEHLEELMKDHPDNLNLLWVISDFYESIDKKEKCLEYLTKIEFIDPFNRDINEKIKNMKIQIERGNTPVADTQPEVNLTEDLFENPEDEFKEEVNSGMDEEIISNEEETGSETIVGAETEADVKEVAVTDSETENVLETKNEDDDFMTISAAELYIDQGLYKDALLILENIYKKDNVEAILEKIDKIKIKIKTERKIKVLNDFIDVIKKKGVKLV